MFNYFSIINIKVKTEIRIFENFFPEESLQNKKRESLKKKTFVLLILIDVNFIFFS